MPPIYLRPHSLLETRLVLRPANQVVVVTVTYPSQSPIRCPVSLLEHVLSFCASESGGEISPLVGQDAVPEGAAGPGPDVDATFDS